MSEQEKVREQETSLWKEVQKWSRELKRDVIALYFAIKHPKTPWYAKAVAGIVVGYALSPIDLIPDFVPVLGYLDDMILLPLGIAIVIKFLPDDVIKECRQEALLHPPSIKPKSWGGAFIIATVWLLAAYGFYLFLK